MNTAVKFTYEEYRTLPENGRHYQVIDGDLIMSRAPKTRHQDVFCCKPFLRLALCGGRERGMVFCAPLDVILSDENIVQPDIAYVSNERRGVFFREGLRGTPDLCVEFLSPSNRELDLNAKRLLTRSSACPNYGSLTPTRTRSCFPPAGGLQGAAQSLGRQRHADLAGPAGLLAGAERGFRQVGAVCFPRTQLLISAAKERR